MPWMFLTGPDEYLQLLESVGRDGFTVHMDILNWINTLQGIFLTRNLYVKLGKHIKSCHLKDVKMEDNYTLFWGKLMLETVG